LASIKGGKQKQMFTGLWGGRELLQCFQLAMDLTLHSQIRLQVGFLARQRIPPLAGFSIFQVRQETVGQGDGISGITSLTGSV